MRRNEIGLHRQHRLKLRHRLCVLSRVVVVKAEIGIDRQRQWFALARNHDLPQGLRRPAGGEQQNAVPLVCRRPSESRASASRNAASAPAQSQSK